MLSDSELSDLSRLSDEEEALLNAYSGTKSIVYKRVKVGKVMVDSGEPAIITDTRTLEGEALRRRKLLKANCAVKINDLLPQYKIDRILSKSTLTADEQTLKSNLDAVWAKYDVKKLQLTSATTLDKLESIDLDFDQEVY